MTFTRTIFLSFVLFVISLRTVQAQPSLGYYNNAVGKNQKDLKTALHIIINPHTAIEYYSSATHFRSTDWHSSGYFWDMYSNRKATTWSGSGLNREHNLPKSWFGISSGEENSEPIGTDLHNLYPSDATANSAKSNFPLGVVGANPSFNNTVVKVGTSAFTGYSGTVFEPANEYKGDFARCYMYMVTCYEDYANRWTSTGTASMLYNNTYPVFKPYAINLLMQWHRNDPVSSKEINRNNAVEIIQNNRNPFVDFPVLAEYIWGEFQGEQWDGTNNEPGNFYVYYNNTTHKLFVSVLEPLDAVFIIYNTSGLKMLEGKPDSEGSINVSALPEGLYVAVVYAKGKRHAEKFLHGEFYN